MAPLPGAALQGLLSALIWLSTLGFPNRQLVIIMLDGMRWDYMELLTPGDLGGFIHFKKTGLRVEYVETVFPSVSLPAWTTLQTGLFPESHNVLGNRMYDCKTGLEFNGSTSQLPMWWQDVEPIWVTVTKQGLRAATLEWNRADVPVHGILPEVAKGYTHSKRDFADRIDEVICRLKSGFDLVMMYHGEIDSMGHEFGPASLPVMLEMQKVGRGLQSLFSYVTDEGHTNRVHVMVVSDHGMAPAWMIPYVNLSHFIDMKKTTEKVICDMGSVAIYAKPGQSGELLMKLQMVPGFVTRLRENIPDEFHYKDAGRAPDLLMYSVPSDERTTFPRCSGGGHGLDPVRVPSMRAFFAAWGAAFADGGLVHRPMHLVDVYQLYAHVLNVQPRPHNGSWLNVRRLLRGVNITSAQEPTIARITSNQGNVQLLKEEDHWRAEAFEARDHQSGTEERQHPKNNLQMGSLEHENRILDSCDCSTSPANALLSNNVGHEISEQSINSFALKDTESLPNAQDLKTEQVLEKMHIPENSYGKEVQELGNVMNIQTPSDYEKVSSDQNRLGFEIDFQTVPSISYPSKKCISQQNDQIKLSVIKDNSKERGEPENVPKIMVPENTQELQAQYNPQYENSISNPNVKKISEKDPQEMSPNESMQCNNVQEKSPLFGYAVPNDSSSKLYSEKSTEIIGSAKIIPFMITMQMPDNVLNSLKTPIPNCHKSGSTELQQSTRTLKRILDRQNDYTHGNIDVRDSRRPSYNTKHMEDREIIPSAQSLQVQTTCANSHDPSETKLIQSAAEPCRLQTLNNTKVLILKSENSQRDVTTTQSLHGYDIHDVEQIQYPIDIRSSESSTTSGEFQDRGSNYSFKYVQDMNVRDDVESRATRRNEIKTLSNMKRIVNQENMNILDRFANHALSHTTKTGIGDQCTCDTQVLEKPPKENKLKTLHDIEKQENVQSNKNSRYHLNEKRKDVWKDKTSPIIYYLQALNAGIDKKLKHTDSANAWTEDKEIQQIKNENNKYVKATEKNYNAVDRSHDSKLSHKEKEKYVGDSEPKNENYGTIVKNVDTLRKSKKGSNVRNEIDMNEEGPRVRLNTNDASYYTGKMNMTVYEKGHGWTYTDLDGQEREENAENMNQMVPTTKDYYNKKEAQEVKDANHLVKICGKSDDGKDPTEYIKIAHHGGNVEINKNIGESKKTNVQNGYHEKKSHSKGKMNCKQCDMNGTGYEYKLRDKESKNESKKGRERLHDETSVTSFDSFPNQCVSAGQNREEETETHFVPVIHLTKKEKDTLSTVKLPSIKNEINRRPKDSNRHCKEVISSEVLNVEAGDNANLKFDETAESKRNMKMKNALQGDMERVSTFRYLDPDADSKRQSATQRHLEETENVNAAEDVEKQYQKWNSVKYVNRIRRSAEDSGIDFNKEKFLKSKNMNAEKEQFKGMNSAPITKRTKPRQAEDTAKVVSRESDDIGNQRIERPDESERGSETADTTQSSKNTRMVEDCSTSLHPGVQDVSETDINNKKKEYLQQPSNSTETMDQQITQPCTEAVDEHITTTSTQAPSCDARVTECECGEGDVKSEGVDAGREEYLQQRRAFTRAWDEHFATVRAGRVASGDARTCKQTAREATARRSQDTPSLLVRRGCW